MSLKLENNDDDSFIILGTSPGTSLDLKCDGNEGPSIHHNGDAHLNGDMSIDKAQMKEALKDLSSEANMAFKAHFNLVDCPSPASMMVASTIITEDRSTEELQKRFGELLDENVILKETLKQNNDSIKEQFLLIASCQEDMLKTHMMHKEKFDETKELVERLRQENKKLKLDVSRLTDGDAPAAVNSENEEQGKSGPPSALEFVTSPDDDTINKLTAQLDLVEKQRRQVIVENERLTWQKESLEHIVDATSKERDDLKEKLKKVELQLSTRDSEDITEMNNLNYEIQELQKKLHNATASKISTDELIRRDAVIEQLEVKISTLQVELRNAQLKILELENVKLEFSRHKSSINETVKLYKDQIQDLHKRLKETSTTVFQPVRISLSMEAEPASTEYASYVNNVKLYDRTLKHISDLLNKLTYGLSDSLVQTLGVVASLYDFKLDKTSVEQFKAGLAEVKQQLEKQHAESVSNIGQVRGTMSIFEGIFKDHNELLKKVVTKQEAKQQSPVNVEALTAALVARGQELQIMEAEINRLKADKEDREVLRAQLDLYKSDFDAERELREKMACEKENILTDLRQTQRRNQELTKQLEELKKQSSTSRSFSTQSVSTASRPVRQTSAPSKPGTTSGNVTYTCPKCMKFSCESYNLLEDHFDFCLDDF